MAYSTTPWRLLIAASMLVLPAVLAASGGYTGRVDLIHVDANGGFTREELMRRAADRSYLRATMLSAAAPAADGSTTPPTQVQVDAKFSPYEYMMSMEVDMAGDLPPLSFMAAADTGSGLVWTKKQMSAVIDDVPCSCTGGDSKLSAFSMTYGNGFKAAKGFICAQQRLSFLPLLSSSKTQTKKTAERGVSLGFALHCDEHLLPASANGIVGLNQGKLSLITQLGVTKFSYCLNNPLIDKAQVPNSPFWFGDGPHSLSLSHLKSTPLVKASDPKAQEMYNVELVRITVGDDGKDVDHIKGGEVLFIDSGCAHSFLKESVFGLLKKQLVGQLGTSEPVTRYGKVHTCFPAPDSDKKKPALLLRFKDDAQMEIPWENYMLQDELAKKAGQFCLAIYESTAGVSILGNILQHNIYMQYDLTNEKLWFKQVPDCSNL